MGLDAIGGWETAFPYEKNVEKFGGVVDFYYFCIEFKEN